MARTRALAPSQEHQAEFDAEMEKQAERLQALRAATGESPMERRLRSLARPR